MLRHYNHKDMLVNHYERRGEDSSPPPPRDNVTGKTYLERGQPVLVLIRWAGKGPRNVLIQRANGSRVVRPFRGLRRPSPR